MIDEIIEVIGKGNSHRERTRSHVQSQGKAKVRAQIA